MVVAMAEEVVGGGVACAGALFEGDFFRLKSFIFETGTASNEGVWRVSGRLYWRCSRKCGCVVLSSYEERALRVFRKGSV